MRAIVFVGLAALASIAACGSDDGVVYRTSNNVPYGMTPTIKERQEVAVRDYAGTAPKRGDVIAFWAPTMIGKVFLKRVIGLPGDTVGTDKVTGIISVNGTLLSEPYAAGPTGCTDTCRWTVPAAETEIRLKYQADQKPRQHLSDYRQEEAACRRTGCYFVLGDLRMNSADSRTSGGWLVPGENILGWVKVD